jgi:hypothetical protein
MTPDPAKKQRHPEAEAQCVGCGYKQWFGPGEVERASVPFCPKCYMPMASTGKARIK